jgi:hypothetical protein
MKEPELVLFSGGPDSTILLNYLLKKKKNIHVLYIQLGYNVFNQQRIPLQNIAVTKILTYFKEKGFNFNYINSGLFLNVPSDPSLNSFGTDDQWSVFLAGVICRMYNIKKIWAGFYSYTYDNRKELLGYGPDWIFDGSLNEYIKYGTLGDPNFKDIQYLTPRSVFNRTEIDSFKTKKEAFDSLDTELKKMVRSCYENVKFCGQCYKCKTYIHHKITDANGNFI